MSGTMRRRLGKLEQQAGGTGVEIQVWYEGEPPTLCSRIYQDAGGRWITEVHAGSLNDGPCLTEPCERCRG